MVAGSSVDDKHLGHTESQLLAAETQRRRFTDTRMSAAEGFETVVHLAYVLIVVGHTADYIETFMISI